IFEVTTEEVGTFDLVIACEVIEHVAHPKELLIHLKSFLDPDGRLLLTTPNGLHFRNRLPTYDEISDVDALERRQFMPDADGHLFLLTPSELRQLAQSVGYEIETLNLWGTPALTGHCGLRYLASRWCIKLAYGIEAIIQGCSEAIRQRMCFAMSAVL